LPYGKRILFPEERGVLGCGVQHHQELRAGSFWDSSSFAGSSAEDGA
jgi:hypothetical protein